MTIRLYTGFGSCTRGSTVLREELQRHLVDEVETIGDNEIRHSNDWMHKTTALFFSGKSVGEFKYALKADGLAKIRGGVFAGQFNYVGICAGAAFAASEIYYTMKLQEHEKPYLKSSEGLGFFHGCAIGPVAMFTPAFTGLSDNLSLIPIFRHATGKTHKAVYWGGPALLPYPGGNCGSVQAISVVPKAGLPMSVRLRYGQGDVTLCSYHPEMTSQNLAYWTDTKNLPMPESQRLAEIGKAIDPHSFQNFLVDAGFTLKR
jgi:glutamine amidotransferase-like uncharacterized protein